MEFGFYLPNSGERAQPDALASLARLGDRLGFNCMVAPDHILMPRQVDSVYPYSVTGNILAGGNSGAGEWPEQVTTLAFLGRGDRAYQVGDQRHDRSLPQSAALRQDAGHPGHAFQGPPHRGAGVGWMEEEFQLLDAPPFAERGAATDEYLRAFIELWSADNPSFDGKYVSSRTSSSFPGRCSSPTRPSGSAGRAGPPCAAPPGWAMPGIPWGPYPPRRWSRRNWPVTWPTCTRHAEQAGRDPSEIQVTMKAPLYDSSSDGAGSRRRFTGSTDAVLAGHTDIRRSRRIAAYFRFPKHAARERRSVCRRFSEDVMAAVA